MEQVNRYARERRRHQESEVEVEKVRQELNEQLTFKPDLQAQQVALRGKPNPGAKSQKLLRRRQKAAGSAFASGGERSHSSTVAFLTPGGPGQKNSGNGDKTFMTKSPYTQKLLSPSSASIPKQDAPPVISTTDSPLLAEKKGWVDRLKRENAQLVDMLSVARSAKQQVMKAAERLDIEQSKLSAKELASTEQDLEHLLAALPIAKKVPAGSTNSAEEKDPSLSYGLNVAPSAANDSAASARLHSTITRLLFRLRANQMNVFERSLEAARYAEDAFLEGHPKSATTAVQQLRDVVQYLDLGQFFDEKWGEGSIDVLRRRFIAMHTGSTRAQTEKQEDEETKLVKANEAAAKETEISELKQRIAELEKDVTDLTRKNKAMQNNVLRLKARKRDGATTGTPGKVATQATTSPPMSQGVESPVGNAELAEEPSWNGLSGDLAKICWARLVDKTTGMVRQEPLADRLTPQVISEVAEYVATELSSQFSMLLKPHIEAELGANSAAVSLSESDVPRATEICDHLLEDSSVTSEITPLIKMALTYVQSRSSSP